MIDPIGEYRVLSGKERQPISGMDEPILWNRSGEILHILHWDKQNAATVYGSSNASGSFSTKALISSRMRR
jgi:hypothetical protein